MGHYYENCSISKSVENISKSTELKMKIYFNSKNGLII